VQSTCVIISVINNFTVATCFSLKALEPVYYFFSVQPLVPRSDLSRDRLQGRDSLYLRIEKQIFLLSGKLKYL